jgi:AcrR family transcriptional regulator
MAESSRRTQRDRIVAAAIGLAEENGWGNLRLHQVADRLGLSLAAVRAEFRDRDAIADAWFARALDEVLSAPPAEIAGRPPPERLLAVTMRWFDALAPNRTVAREMLREKLYPGHPQHWGPLIADLSRLIHWFLDAARIASTGRARQLAEIGLTALFLAALRSWLRDDSHGQLRAREQLERGLEVADRWLPRLTSTPRWPPRSAPE